MATIKKTEGKRGVTYKITVSCGYGPDGAQIRRHMTYRPDPGATPRQAEKAVQREAVLFEERCRMGGAAGAIPRLSDFVEIWMKDYAAPRLRPKTLDGYRLFFKRILSALGHLRLDKIQPRHLLAFYSNLAETGVREDVKYRARVDFKVLLKERGLTKARMSELAGVSVTVLNSLTQKKNVSPNSARLVAGALGMGIDALFEAQGGEKPLSPETIHHYHALLSSVLATAVQWQMLPANPCARVKPPRLERSPPRYLDEVEAARLLELLEGEEMRYKTAARLLLYTGLRRGELCGLEWEDIDFERSLIHVRRSSLYVPEKGVFTDTTKNETSKRSLKAPRTAMDILLEYKRWQTEEKLKLGGRWQAGGRIFTAWDGSPMNPTVLTGWFRRFIKKHNLPDISLHSLRHTNATLQIAGGVPLPTISKRLGHADSATTGRVYVHAIRSADEAAAETLENILTPDKNRKKPAG